MFFLLTVDVIRLDKRSWLHPFFVQLLWRLITFLSYVILVINHMITSPVADWLDPVLTLSLTTMLLESFISVIFISRNLTKTIFRQIRGEKFSVQKILNSFRRNNTNLSASFKLYVYEHTSTIISKTVVSIYLTDRQNVREEYISSQSKWKLKIFTTNCTGNGRYMISAGYRKFEEMFVFFLSLLLWDVYCQLENYIMVTLWPGYHCHPCLKLNVEQNLP